MRIAVFTDGILPRIDGISISVDLLLIRLSQKGHKLIVWGPKQPNSTSYDRKLNSLGIKINRCPSISTHFDKNLKVAIPFPHKSLTQLNNFNPDLIHCITEYTLGLTGVVYANRMNIPCVSTFHTYYMKPEYVKSNISRYFVSTISNILKHHTTYMHNQFNIVTTPSESVKNTLKNMGIKRKIVAIPNAITPFIKNQNVTSKREILKKYNLKRNILLYVGRISVEKSIDMLLYVMDDVVNNKLSNISLLIVGDGPDMKRLQGIVNSKKLNEYVIFTGEIPNKELLNSGIYQAADAFVTASNSEVQSISVLEAMSFGLPLITVEEKGMKEVAGNFSLMSPYGDINSFSHNIDMFFKNSILQKRLRENALKRSKHHTVEAMVKKYEKVYQEAINLHKSSPKNSKSKSPYRCSFINKSV